MQREYEEFEYCDSGKVCYSKVTAQTKSNYFSNNRRTRKGNGKKLRSYQCSGCNWFHLTHYKDKYLPKDKYNQIQDKIKHQFSKFNKNI